MKTFAALLVMLLLALSPVAHALSPDEVLPDAGLEARARSISSELRCLVCQNQSIDDSDAELARDLRLVVRERLVAGDDDDSVRAFVVARYGEFVLLRPVFALHTLVLWIAGPLLLAIGALTLFFNRRRNNAPLQADGLTPDEQAALATLDLPTPESPKA